MPNHHDANRVLPFLEGFPARDRQLADKGFSQQEGLRLKAEEARGRKADAAVESIRRKFHDLVGARKMAEIREMLDRERLAFRDLLQPPEGLRRDYGQHKKKHKRKTDALIRKLGVSPEKLTKINGVFRKELEETLSAIGSKVVPGYNLHKNLDKWTRLSPLHKFPLAWGPHPWDPADPHRWFLFRPPFFGFLFRFAPQASSNFRVDRELILDPSAGLVGNEATMDCGDAGSYDYASVTAESQIAFGFEAPATGLVEVLVDAQSTFSTHGLEFEDEWGFSDAWCNQNNYLMMNVLHPNVPEPSLALMSNVYKESDGDDLYEPQREHLIRGQHYFARLFSSGPVQAGRSVVVTVGTRTFDKARANDMELHSRTHFEWFINSVEVRIAPGGGGPVSQPGVLAPN